jgi:flagellar hook-associated protein 2
MATSSGSITSTGIGSGLDAASIMSKLMAVEALPLNRLQTQATSFNSQLSTMGKLQGNISALRDKSNTLVDSTLWTSTKASVSDETALRVSTGAGASAGSFEVRVNRLASTQTVASNAFAASNTPFGAGSLTIALGSYAADGGFTGKTDSSAVTVDISEGASLAEVRDKINAANAGVLASIVTDANGARLTLRSRETGADNAFRVSASETVDDASATTGLSALGYDAGDAASTMARTATAANADLTINGIAVTSASNTLDNVVDGLSFTLSKASTTPVNVVVAQDTTAIKTAITDFVAAFNTAASFIKSQTAYNADNKTAGALQGDQGTLSLQAQLRNVINQGSTASSSFSRLSDIGITMKADGTLDVNSSKLDNAMGNLSELRKLLGGDGNNSASTGFVRRFKNLATAALGTDGMFDSRSASLRTRLTSNSKAQEAMNLRLDAIQARLQKQYTALDTTMASLNTLSSYMTQQITQMNK